MTKKANLSKIILFLLVVFVLSSSSIFLTYGETENNEAPSVRLVVHVLDIDQSQRHAEVKIVVFVDNYPHNLTQVEVRIIGGGDVIVSCNNTGTIRGNEWYYQGESNQTEWLVQGLGEAFPFDSYLLRFKVYCLTYFQSNFSLSSDITMHQAFFAGPKFHSLKDLWLLENGLLPIDNIGAKEISFVIRRSFSALIIAALQFLFPIVACYYLLGATLMLDPKKQLAERLRIHLSLFVFVPTFLIAIHTFLPYRSTLSFPEFLLVNLIVSNTIFGIFSIVGNQRTPDRAFIVRLYTKETFHSRWDAGASIVSLVIFAVIYFFTTFGKMTTPASLFFSYVILPSYVYWYLFTISKEQFMQNKHKYAVMIILFLVPIFVYIILWLLVSR